VTPAGSVVRLPRSAPDQVDYEGELAIVIGREGKNISVRDALDHVFGYTIANDVSARDQQFAHGQWFKGKNLDTFCPLGPSVTTPDEIDPSHGLRLVTKVNGEVRQDDKTSNLIFGVAVLIEELSRGLTLYPGDVILTGTPEGVGFGMQPPRFLADGDVIEIEVDGIGTLVNSVKVVNRH
jgi:2-keto-4-pentenoate hydratase/2-oxohepta-3-ene-1,7-dioic acid hydratase in catechol pathway